MVAPALVVSPLHVKAATAPLPSKTLSHIHKTNQRGNRGTAGPESKQRQDGAQAGRRETGRMRKERGQETLRIKFCDEHENNKQREEDDRTDPNREGAQILRG